jgi:AcrR family transcriptional regulator
MKVNEHALLEAALPVFKRQGIRGTHLSNIAQACGIRLQELKNQFHTKKILVSAFVEFLLIRHASYLQVNPVLSPTAITELENFFQFIEKLAAELTPSMLLELKKYSVAGWHKLKEFKAQMLVPYLQQNLKRGVDEGLYRKDIEPELYVELYFDMLFVIVTELNIPLGISKRLLPIFHKLFLRGLLNTRGARM